MNETNDASDTSNTNGGDGKTRHQSATTHSWGGRKKRPSTLMWWEKCDLPKTHQNHKELTKLIRAEIYNVVKLILTCVKTRTTERQYHSRQQNLHNLFIQSFPSPRTTCNYLVTTCYNLVIAGDILVISTCDNL